jgi:hypothetical protein
VKYEIVKEYSPARFKAAIGVTKETFDAMAKVLHTAYIKRHQKHNGRHRKLCIEDMLLAALEYLYEYRTYECIGASYGLTKQSMHDTIKWVENELIACGLFSLPGKKALHGAADIEVILADTTETPIQRPKKGQKYFYSGKKTAYAENPNSSG